MKSFKGNCSIIYTWIQRLTRGIGRNYEVMIGRLLQWPLYQSLEHWLVSHTARTIHSDSKIHTHLEPVIKYSPRLNHLLFIFPRLQNKIGWMIAIITSCILITGCQHSRSLLATEAIKQLQGTAVMVISSDVQLRIANKILENRLLDLINNRQQSPTKKLIITLSYSSNTTDIRGGGVTDRYRLTIIANYRLIGSNDTVITSGLVSNTGNYETDLNYYRDSQARYEAMRDLINELAQSIYYQLLKHYYP